MDFYSEKKIMKEQSYTEIKYNQSEIPEKSKCLNSF